MANRWFGHYRSYATINLPISSARFLSSGIGQPDDKKVSPAAAAEAGIVMIQAHIAPLPWHGRQKMGRANSDNRSGDRGKVTSWEVLGDPVNGDVGDEVTLSGMPEMLTVAVPVNAFSPVMDATAGGVIVPMVARRFEGLG